MQGGSTDSRSWEVSLINSNESLPMRLLTFSFDAMMKQEAPQQGIDIGPFVSIFRVLIKYDEVLSC